MKLTEIVEKITSPAECPIHKKYDAAIQQVADGKMSVEEAVDMLIKKGCIRADRRTPALNHFRQKVANIKKPIKENFEEDLDADPESSERNQEVVERLGEIADEIVDLVEEARRLLPDGMASKRAEAYWIPHILMNVRKEHEYLGGSMVTMEDTIEELQEKEEEE